MVGGFNARKWWLLGTWKEIQELHEHIRGAIGGLILPLIWLCILKAQWLLSRDRKTTFLVSAIEKSYTHISSMI